VIHSETKLDTRKLSVTEITVPQQWIAYQYFLARMDRIYYLDMPSRYASNPESTPVPGIRNFADFFIERDEVLGLAT